jgi:hypothetical protein
LPQATAQTLTLLFQTWGIVKQDAEQLADAILGWMKRNHIYTTAVHPNYDMAAVPFEAPGRSLRSYHELRAIEKAREIFYDRDGRPNDLWLRFVGSVSLLNFQRPNINGAKPDTLAALGQFDEIQQQNIGAYLSGTGNHQATGPGYFQSPNDALRIAGSTGDAGAFSVTISALRINVTVRAGQTEYRVSTVISPPNGATPVQTTATMTRTETSSATAGRPSAPRTGSTSAQAPNAQAPNAAAKARQSPSNRATATAPNQANANERNLKYPFTLLEIYENDEIPSVQPAGSPVTGGD